MPSLGSLFNKIGDAFSKIGELFDVVKRGFTEATGFFKKIGNFFKDISSGLNKISNGFREVFEGVPKGLKYGFNDMGVFLAYIFEYITLYVSCGVKFIGNFQKCVFFYAMDIIGQLVYLPIRIALFIIWCAGLRSVYSYEKTIWDYIDDADMAVFGMSGYHFMHWPKDVRENCYNCKRLKTEIIPQKSKMFVHDWNHEIWAEITRGAGDIKDGGEKIKRAFG
jgi:hypothetical protein